MKRADRYLLRQYLPSLGLCALGFSFVYILLDGVGYAGRFARAGTPVRVLAVYYLCWVLPYLEYLLPAALLFATLHTLWRLTRNNELVALRSCGLTVGRILRPIRFVSFLVALFILGLKEGVIPRTNPFVAHVRKADYRVHALSWSRDRHAFYYDYPTRQTWEIARIDPFRPRTLHTVHIVEERDDRQRTRAWEIVAQRAEWLDGTWWLFDGRIQEYAADEFQTPIGLARVIPPAGMAITRLRARPQDIAVQAKPWSDLSSPEMWRQVYGPTGLSKRRKAALATDLHYRLAIPWACPIVTMFAAPVGTRNARQGMLGMVLLGVLCFAGFFVLMQLGLYLGMKRILPPPLGAWLANGIFSVAGWWWFRTAQ